MKNIVKFLLLGFSMLLYTGCVSLVETTGRALDGSAFTEKKVAVYRTEKKTKSSAGVELREMRNKANERSVIILLDRFPIISIRASAPDYAGAISLTSVDYLGGGPHGWNEYRLDLSGTGNLLMGETSASFSIPGDVTAVEISSGRIRRYDTRITGAEALTNLRNRRERILALAEWMNEEAPDKSAAPVGGSLKDFEKYWKPLLFPETVSKKKQPDSWQKESDQWVKAEDIRWNISYTERVFPEMLRTIRNSGTMLRDWEEALDWLYVTYEWDRLWEELSREHIMNKQK